VSGAGLEQSKIGIAIGENVGNEDVGEKVGEE
jgi:hypothetical protein